LAGIWPHADLRPCGCADPKLGCDSRELPPYFQGFRLEPRASAFVILARSPHLSGLLDPGCEPHDPRMKGAEQTEEIAVALAESAKRNELRAALEPIGLGYRAKVHRRLAEPDNDLRFR